MNMPIESALIALIPEAEVLVERFRNQYDPSAALGVPAHVTVLYPFKSPPEVTADIIQNLKELLSKFPAFSASFAETGRFPGVLYLSPAPDERFRRLTQIVADRFPETPPYRGQFTDIVPHLTVAQVSDPQRLDKIAVDFERAARGHLPIQSSVREIALMDNESGRWEVRKRFALGSNGESG
jgi:2'-5' RNA ligase